MKYWDEAGIVLVLVNFFLISASDECKVDSHVCAGEGSKWNTTTKSCDCAKYFWGKHCEFGRRRFTSQRGRIAESLGKYHCSSKYMYLIDSGSYNVSIQISLNEFATECNWDYLYIFDGRSIYDPLIASYSGEILEKGRTNSTAMNMIRVTATSGAAYLYFYSDALINHEGFKLSYIMSNCTSTRCQGHGFCEDNGRCRCNEGWTGGDCSEQLCCDEVYNVISNQTNRTCQTCNNSISVIPRASHAVAASGSKMWLYGGYSFNQATASTNNLLLFDLETRKWISRVDTDDRRFGHSMIHHGDSLYVYGGYTTTITNDLLEYKIPSKTWHRHKHPDDPQQQPIAVMGHASVLVGSIIYTFFGFNKKLLYTKFIQKYEIGSAVWSQVVSKGAIVKGRFGHTATYDPVSHVIFIYGGYYDKSTDGELYLFDVKSQTWTISSALSTTHRLQPPNLPRMLHVAGIVGRHLVIFGGNEHKGGQNQKPKCFSSALIAYNIDKKVSTSVPNRQLFLGMQRYGHSAVTNNRSMFVFGGFNGTFRNDLFQIDISVDCDKYTTKELCLKVPVLAGCVWYRKEQKCIFYEKQYPETEIDRTEEKSISPRCKQYTNCVLCTGHECHWDKGKGQCYRKSLDNVSTREMISDPEECDDIESEKCSMNAGCVACEEDPKCEWNIQNANPHATKCRYRTNLKKSKTDISAKCFAPMKGITSCEDVDDCHDCNHLKLKQCMWCESRKQCLHYNSYKISNPYGQCLEWISPSQYTERVHDCKAVVCSEQVTCKGCLQIAACGWCADTSGTGLGKCMDGGSDGDLNSTCPHNRWWFTKCPACQCNGHSTCINGTDKCKQCFGHVTGDHCDKCEPGYFGNPELNHTCTECNCNGHYHSCDDKTGECVCNLRAATGKHCEKCDEKSVGDPTEPNGMCYVNLSVNYQYEPNITNCIKAGFRTRPEKREKSLELIFDAIKTAPTEFNPKLNISIYYPNHRDKDGNTIGKTQSVRSNYPLGKYQKTFTENDYEDFPAEIRAVVWGITMKESVQLKIVVRSPPTLFNLIYFLIMFLVCFCSLLIILIVLWKIKQRYDIFVHNRQQRHEHAERISRPFRHITIFLHDKISSYQKVPPSLIVLEQFASGNIAIASVIIELPRAGNGFSPANHSGICIGSTLVTTPPKWTFNSMQNKYGCDRRRRKTTDRAVAV